MPDDHFNVRMNERDVAIVLACLRLGQLNLINLDLIGLQDFNERRVTYEGLDGLCRNVDFAANYKKGKS